MYCEVCAYRSICVVLHWCFVISKIIAIHKRKPCKKVKFELDIEIRLIPVYQNQGDPGFYVCFVHTGKWYLRFYAGIENIILRMFSHCIQELLEPVFQSQNADCNGGTLKNPIFVWGLDWKIHPMGSQLVYIRQAISCQTAILGMINAYYSNSNLIWRSVSCRVDEVIPSDHPRREASRVIQWYGLIHQTWYCTPDQVTI